MWKGRIFEVKLFKQYFFALFHGGGVWGGIPQEKICTNSFCGGGLGGATPKEKTNLAVLFSGVAPGDTGIG